MESYLKRTTSRAKKLFGDHLYILGIHTINQSGNDIIIDKDKVEHLVDSKTISVHIPGLVDRNNLPLFGSINGNIGGTLVTAIEQSQYGDPIERDFWVKFKNHSFTLSREVRGEVFDFNFDNVKDIEIWGIKENL